MNFSEYSTYEDFCSKTGLHGEAAINFLLEKLTELKKQGVE